MKKIAIAGIGKWGKNLVREFSNLSRKLNVHITECVGTGNPENIKWLKNNYPKIRYTKKYQEVLENKNIDSVVIATPTVTHFQMAIEALNAGKNVFVEKPPADSLHKLKKLLKTTKNTKRILFTNHIFLNTPGFKKLLSVKNKISLISYWQKFGTFEGNIFWDLAYHEIYSSIILFGKPKDIRLLKYQGFITNGDWIEFVIKFAGGKEYYSVINRIASKKFKSQILVTKNYEYEFTDGILYKINRNSSKSQLTLSDSNPLSDSCKQFIKLINRNKKGIDNHYKLILQTSTLVEKLLNQI